MYINPKYVVTVEDTSHLQHLDATPFLEEGIDVTKCTVNITMLSGDNYFLDEDVEEPAALLCTDFNADVEDEEQGF